VRSKEIKMPGPKDDQSCTLCTNDNTEEMVSCDVCDAWAHYDCAGVTADILDFPWHCLTCDPQSVTRKVYDRFMKEREARIEANEKLEKIVGKMEKLQADQATLFAEKEASIKTLHEALKTEEGFAQGVLNLLSSIQEDQNRLIEQTHNNDQVLDKLKNLMDTKSGIVENPLGGPNKSEDGSRSAELLEKLKKLREDSEKSKSSNISSNDNSAMENLFVVLGRSLIQKLPDFYGDEFEWAYFESVFNSTTKAGKYSEEENVARLRQAIKGEAKSFVNDQLMFSTKASEIMDQLRLRFGDTSVVLTRRMNDLISHPAVTKVNDVQLPKLANKLRIFVATAKCLQKENDLNQDYALSLIADKLKNTTYYIQWKRKKLAKSSLNLEDFGEFLQEKVREMPPDLQLGVPLNSGCAQNRDLKKQHKGKFMMHVEASKQCLKCGNSHFMWKCPEFVAMSLEERWNFVRTKRICRCCVSTIEHHQNNCPWKKACGVSGCKALHNRILHYVKKPEEKSESSS